MAVHEGVNQAVAEFQPDPLPLALFDPPGRVREFLSERMRFAVVAPLRPAPQDVVRVVEGTELETRAVFGAVNEKAHVHQARAVDLRQDLEREVPLDHRPDCQRAPLVPLGVEEEHRSVGFADEGGGRAGRPAVAHPQVPRRLRLHSEIRVEHGFPLPAEGGLVVAGGSLRQCRERGHLFRQRRGLGLDGLRLRRRPADPGREVAERRADVGANRVPDDHAVRQRRDLGLVIDFDRRRGAARLRRTARSCRRAPSRRPSGRGHNSERSEHAWGLQVKRLVRRRGSKQCQGLCGRV